MCEAISVLIADDNVQLGDILRQYINQNDDLSVKGVARDGVQAIKMISSLQPDVVILDIIMPNLDGIGVLERLSTMQLSQKPSFIMLTGLGQDRFIQKAMELGAEYYIVKPFDVDILVSRIRQAYREKHVSQFAQNKLPSSASQKNAKMHCDKDIEAVVSGLMRSIGIPPHMIGYQYIREAIMQSINNTKAFSSVTTILYPSIAQKFNSTPQRVERAIRNAIESAWSRGHSEHLSSFGFYVANGKSKPTNSEFIAVMADKARIALRENF